MTHAGGLGGQGRMVLVPGHGQFMRRDVITRPERHRRELVVHTAHADLHDLQRYAMPLWGWLDANDISADDHGRRDDQFLQDSRQHDRQRL